MIRRFYQIISRFQGKSDHHMIIFGRGVEWPQPMVFSLAVTASFVKMMYGPWTVPRPTYYLPRLEREIGPAMKWQGDKNSGKPWTPADVKQLKDLAKQNTPTRVIGGAMGRTPDAVYKKASEENISLEPTNQSPYNRQKKG
jgi:hypothetical protein